MQHYGSTRGIKGGKMLTSDVRAIFYDAHNIFLADEIRKKRGMGENNALLARRCCFVKHVEFTSS